jgi:hypothetical protein
MPQAHSHEHALASSHTTKQLIPLCLDRPGHNHPHSMPSTLHPETRIRTLHAQTSLQCPEPQTSLALTPHAAPRNATPCRLTSSFSTHPATCATRDTPQHLAGARSRHTCSWYNTSIPRRRHALPCKVNTKTHRVPWCHPAWHQRRANKRQVCCDQQLPEDPKQLPDCDRASKQHVPMGTTWHWEGAFSACSCSPHTMLHVC